MTTDELAALIMDLLTEADLPDRLSVATFEADGVLTSDDGLRIRINGEKFDVTVTRA